MARRRGLGDAERLAVDFTAVTATGAVIAAPCFVYSLDWTLSDTSVSGLFTLADTTSTADVVKESAKWSRKVGMTVASGCSDQHGAFNFAPPLYVANNLYWGVSTGISSISVSYLAAS